MFDNVAPGERLTTADNRGSFIVNYGGTSPFGDNAVVLSDFRAIPEPATFALLAAGVPLVLRRLRRRG